MSAKARTKIVWEGSASLRRLLVPTDTVIPHPDNPRRGNLAVIAESLRTFGQVRPILVNKRTGFIVAGNHTYRAAIEELGWNRIARVLADLDDQAERKYLLADNRTSDLGSYDDEVLTRVLSDLAEDDALAGTGWTGDDLDDLVAKAQEGEVAGLEGVTKDRSYAEALERYRVAATRSLMLDYPNAVYAWVQESLDVYREQTGIESNADALLKLLADATGRTPPEVEEADED